MKHRKPLVTINLDHLFLGPESRQHQCTGSKSNIHVVQVKLILHIEDKGVDKDPDVLATLNC